MGVGVAWRGEIVAKRDHSLNWKLGLRVGSQTDESPETILGPNAANLNNTPASCLVRATFVFNCGLLGVGIPVEENRSVSPYNVQCSSLFVTKALHRGYSSRCLPDAALSGTRVNLRPVVPD